MLTTGGKITVGFDRWHTYVSTYVGIEIGESVENAMEIIEDFVNEETVVMIVERDGRWVQSSLVRRSELSGDLPDGKVRPLSWKGRFEEEFELTTP